MTCNRGNMKRTGSIWFHHLYNVLPNCSTFSACFVQRCCLPEKPSFAKSHTVQHCSCQLPPYRRCCSEACMLRIQFYSSRNSQLVPYESLGWVHRFMCSWPHCELPDYINLSHLNEHHILMVQTSWLEWLLYTVCGPPVPVGRITFAWITVSSSRTWQRHKARKTST